MKMLFSLNSKSRHVAPAAAIGAAFAIWIAAMGAMVLFPPEPYAASRDVMEPTGLSIVYQDAKTLETVVVRDSRPVLALAPAAASECVPARRAL